MDKHTRLRVTLGIDVKVVAPTGNTTAYKLRVVLEIHGKDRLAVLASRFSRMVRYTCSRCPGESSKF